MEIFQIQVSQYDSHTQILVPILSLISFQSYSFWLVLCRVLSTPFFVFISSILMGRDALLERRSGFRLSINDLFCQLNTHHQTAKN